VPQPAANDATAQRLIGLYRDAQANLLSQLQAAVEDPNQRRRVARLRELIRTLDPMRSTLEAGTKAWLTNDLAAVHVAGATLAATQLGADFAWTMPHRAAVEQLAGQMWSDVAVNLRDMTAETKRSLRKLAQDSARETVLEGQTAAQSADDFAAWASEQGIVSVEYGNGARHLIDDYADMATRTTTASAYNNGTLVETRKNGVGYVECFDGNACGWDSHNSADRANGTVRTVEDAANHPLSHPRCARSFAPRPDIGSQNAADAAARYGREQQAVLDVEEQLRAEKATTTLTGRARAGNAGRQPRTARTGRTPRQSRLERSGPSPTLREFGFHPPAEPAETIGDAVEHWSQTDWSVIMRKRMESLINNEPIKASTTMDPIFDEELTGYSKRMLHDLVNKNETSSGSLFRGEID
jgi:hypothetical protein